MIRIKVFPIRKILYNLEIFLAYISFFIVLFFFLTLLYSKKDEIIFKLASKNIYEKNDINLIEDIVKSNIKNLYVAVYKNSKDKEKEDEYKKEEKELEYINKEKIDNNEFIKNNNIEIEINEEKQYTRPSEYKTELLQNGKIKVGKANITNYTKRAIDIQILKSVSTKKINSDTNFLIFHTHTSETYTIEKEKYTDFYRTEDEKYNISSVGDALRKALSNKGYKCLHNKTVHDYPSYNGAYKASLATVENLMKTQKYDFVIDIHRDAISSNYNYRPTVEINGESVAKLMFVIGTNSSGLKHDNWLENLKLAIMIQNRAEEMYPGLFREINLSKSRYNQHVSTGAMILEVGATGNSLEEAQNAMKYFAEVINSLKE